MSDWVIVCSGIGANDDYIQAQALARGGPGGPRVAFWDVDAPFNLQAAFAQPTASFAARIPAWDHIFTYGGGPLVVQHYTELGAQAVSPIYNAVDPAEYYPVPPDPALACDLLLMANRMPDREARIGALFLHAAELAPEYKFVLGGNGWAGAARPPNVEWIGHVPTADHARRNCSARLVLNVNRAAMAAYGYSPPTRVFEAAGNAACLITDAWEGIDAFFTPDREILVADSAEEIAHYVRTVDAARAQALGQAAHARALRDHTYAQRARAVDAIIRDT